MPIPVSHYLLHAEDDLDDRLILADIVRDTTPGLEVVTCTNGLELMQFLQRIPVGTLLPSLIVLDMNMPVWDGLVTLEALKAHPVFQPLTVIMFSTSSAQRDAERAQLLGAAFFLTKPVTRVEFMAVRLAFAQLFTSTLSIIRTMPAGYDPS